MLIEPAKLVNLCHTIEEASANGHLAVDRESLLSIHKALVNLKEEIERALSQLPDDDNTLN